METKDSNLKYIKAKTKVERIKGFYNHVAVYVIVNLVITGFKVSNNLDSWESFKNELLTVNVWSVWLIWGIFLVLHFLSFKYGLDWEERKIDELMKKELSKHKD